MQALFGVTLSCLRLHDRAASNGPGYTSAVSRIVHLSFRVRLGRSRLMSDGGEKHMHEARPCRALSRRSGDLFRLHGVAKRSRTQSR